MQHTQRAWPMGTKVQPTRWTYPMLAAHLGVARRTLVRYVVEGSIPQPTTVGTTCFWEGMALAKAKEGRGIPGTFDYTPSPREKRRQKTTKKHTAGKVRKVSNGSNQGRDRKASAESGEGQT